MLRHCAHRRRSPCGRDRRSSGYFAPTRLHSPLAVTVSSCERSLPDSSVSSARTCADSGSSARLASQWLISSSYAKTEALVTAKMVYWQPIALMPPLYCPQAPAQNPAIGLPRIQTLLVHSLYLLLRIGQFRNMTLLARARVLIRLFRLNAKNKIALQRHVNATQSISITFESRSRLEIIT